MAIKKKYLQPQDLTSIETFEIDNRPESVYFNVIDLEETIPADIKTQSIEARVLAFKTKLLNLKDLKNLSFIDKKDILFATKEVFVAFSNLNLQINKKLEKDSQNIERPY